MDNPTLSLKNINDIEIKIIDNRAASSDYETIDFFIASIGANTNYIKNILLQNGISDFSQYIKLRSENSEGWRIQLSRIYGSIMGALSFLKTYVLKNNFDL